MDLSELTRPELPRDLPWLKLALQAAIELEFFTIPPYLTAMWSIVDIQDPAVKVLRTVIYEEMEHMALACNLLVAIGGQPEINTREAVPSYPNPMPGNVNPKLIVPLRPFSHDVVRDFMEIEKPENPVDLRMMGLERTIGDEVFARIGVLYTEIENAFVQLDGTFLWNVDRQIAGPLANMVTTKLSEARAAIETIRSQGEGSPNHAVSATGEVAHYYRFQQYSKEKMRPIVLVPKSPKAPDGIAFGKDELTFPEVYPMAEVPEGGYSYEMAKPEAVVHLRAFDRAYSSMLDHLQAAWSTTGQAGLYLAIEQMFELQGSARSLMQIALPNSSRTYGPHFRNPLLR